MILFILLALLAPTCTVQAPGPIPTHPTADLETSSTPGSTTTSTPSVTHTSTPTFTPPATLTPTSTLPPTKTPTPSLIPSPTKTITPSPSPTYAVLRGEVLELSNCRYGPGAMYLYKYALIPGSNLEVYGRTDSGAWILVRAIGGTNPCWVKATLMDVKGDVMSVEPVYLPLPQSPYYGPLTGVSASRNGDQVTISWNPINLRAGDDTASPIHLVEAWVCQAGEIVFVPVGTDASSAEIEDQAGCSEPSHARVYGVEKHGYTRPVEVPWPARSAFHERFRDHTIRIMQTYGFDILDAWETLTDERRGFVYPLAWSRFRQDEEWKEIKRTTAQKHGNRDPGTGAPACQLFA
jgi:hypothetical protein